MIKQKEIFGANKKQNNSHFSSIQTLRTKAFNTKGYYGVDQMFDEAYINKKIDVFNKYRIKQDEIVMIDAYMTDKDKIMNRAKFNNFIHNQEVKKSKVVQKKCRNVLKQNKIVQKLNSKFNQEANQKNSKKQITENSLPPLTERNKNENNCLIKNYLTRKEKSVGKENLIIALIPSVSRLNTQIISLRRKTNSSLSLHRNVLSRQTNHSNNDNLI